MADDVEHTREALHVNESAMDAFMRAIDAATPEQIAKIRAVMEGLEGRSSSATPARPLPPASEEAAASATFHAVVSIQADAVYSPPLPSMTAGQADELVDRVAARVGAQANKTANRIAIAVAIWTILKDTGLVDAARSYVAPRPSTVADSTIPAATLSASAQAVLRLLRVAPGTVLDLAADARLPSSLVEAALEELRAAGWAEEFEPGRWRAK